jgi:hypothetical protein
MDGVAPLADALHSSLPLFELRGIPGQVNVHLRPQSLEVEAFAGCIGRNEEANLVRLNLLLDVLALNEASLSVAKDERPPAAGIDGDRLAREFGAQSVGNPFRGVVKLTENDRPVVFQPVSIPKQPDNDVDLGVDLIAVQDRGEARLNLLQQPPLMLGQRRPCFGSW